MHGRHSAEARAIVFANGPGPAGHLRTNRARAVASCGGCFWSVKVRSPESLDGQSGSWLSEGDAAWALTGAMIDMIGTVAGACATAQPRFAAADFPGRPSLRRPSQMHAHARGCHHYGVRQVRQTYLLRSVTRPGLLRLGTLRSVLVLFTLYYSHDPEAAFSLSAFPWSYEQYCKYNGCPVSSVPIRTRVLLPSSLRRRVSSCDRVGKSYAYVATARPYGSISPRVVRPTLAPIERKDRSTGMAAESRSGAGDCSGTPK